MHAAELGTIPRPIHEHERPYAPSWLDLAFDWLAALPGPTLLAYLALLVPSILLNSSALWLSGLLPAGQLDPAQALWGTMTVAILAATHYLRNVAESAFDSFRPALGAGVANPEQARYELTVMPARPVLVLTLFAVVITPVYYITDPVAAQVVGVTAVGLVPRIISEGGTSAIVIAILYQAFRQMRRVTRLHAAADHVDPFQPAPLYAFSRLTAQTGIVLILFNTAGIALNPAAVASTATFVALFLPWLMACFTGAIVVFVVPLLGMHRRLDLLKYRLDSEAGERLRGLLGELNEAIDDRAAAQVEALDKTIMALRREREVVARLPTWPWSTGTIRGFGSALFLPIVLFLIQRALGQLLG